MNERRPVIISRRVFLRSLLLGGVALALGCNYSEQSSTTKVDEGEPTQDFGVIVETTTGRTSVELFTSEEYYFSKKEKKVTRAIDDFINSGRHNVTEVHTSYSEGYLTAGRVNYSSDTRGKGNNLRVRLIQSSEYYWQKKDGEVKTGLEEVLKNTQNVYKINTIFQGGYLLAAEVWYFQP